MAKRRRRRARLGDGEITRRDKLRRLVKPLMFVGAGVVVVGLAYVAFGGALKKTPTVAGISPENVKLAAKWAAARGLPLDWVLATILVESGGNPNTVGDYHIDPKGASIGLMQINSVAHAAELAAAGLTRESLFNPDTNIEWGTKILRACFDRVRGLSSSASVDVLTRLCYTGALKSGGNVPDSAATSVATWQRKLAQTSAAA